ncbi:hypothetical protein C8R46DRAFT_1058878 [Mycena filopes]|nr:hypothetical protein C8R46DRAFT_1058878 [Mycena filopes]
MRTFTFPLAGAHTASFSVFNWFPVDVGLAILEHCSPLDLVQLSRTSGFLRTFIDTNPHLWAIAQTNIARGVCPAVPVLPVIEASGNYAQSAYARFLFEGGACTGCSEWTNLPPQDFMFRFRACSSKRCRILPSSVWADTSGKYDDFHWGNWLPRLRIVEELPNGETTITYSYSRRAIDKAEKERKYAVAADAGSLVQDSRFVRRTVTQLNEECERRMRSRPALLENATALQAWHSLYLTEHAAVLVENVKILKGYALAEKKKLQGIMRCPTIVALFTAFNRDLTPITHTVWTHNRERVLCELKAMKDGAFPLGMAPRHNDKVRCAQCPKLVRASNMHHHVLDKHPTVDVAEPLIPQREGPNPCPECPRSKRLYTKRGLKDHRLKKHT